MYPILLKLGSIEIPSWHAFYVIGALAAYYAFVNLARLYASSIAEQDIVNTYLIGYVTGYIGARLLSIIIEQSDLVRQNWLNIVGQLFSLGPMTFYGGFIFALGSTYIYSRIRGLDFFLLADIGLPAGFLALIFGRIGCFLNGDDFGKPVPARFVDSWWSIELPNLGDQIARYPVQILEAFSVLILVIAALALFRRIQTTFGLGSVAIFLVIGYSNLRFVLEFLRDDFRGSVAGTWLSTSQFISLINLLFCACVYLVQYRKRKR